MLNEQNYAGTGGQASNEIDIRGVETQLKLE